MREKDTRLEIDRREGKFLLRMPTDQQPDQNRKLQPKSRTYRRGKHERIPIMNTYLLLPDQEVWMFLQPGYRFQNHRTICPRKQTEAYKIFDALEHRKHAGKPKITENFNRKVELTDEENTREFLS